METTAWLINMEKYGNMGLLTVSHIEKYLLSPTVLCWIILVTKVR